MENTEKRPVFAEDIQKEQKKEHEFTLAPSESAFFSQLEASLKMYAADMTASKPLETLHDNFRRLNRLFISFERPWLADCGIIQKACAWYLAYAKPDKEEARHLVETLNGFYCVSLPAVGMLQTYQPDTGIFQHSGKRIKAVIRLRTTNGEETQGTGGTFGSRRYGILPDYRRGRDLWCNLFSDRETLSGNGAFYRA